MTTLDNSIVFKHVLDALIDISSRKTTLGHAVSTMNHIIKQLEDKYDFLKHVEVNDTRFIEQDESVSVMRDLNNIKSNRLGDALYDIIRTMNIALGKDAGYFFIKELKNNLQDNYITSFEDMGLDLGLMQLEHEIKELTKKIQK
ncbi:hypothetical protein AYK20_02750 [Thermoplasmatales archaeon SG8-52-1]|nr:MAG: hypothetical protein AYK20_02750 [Thermoplasmatales archaeon SG8-52-1]